VHVLSRTREQLVATLQSPQLRRTLDVFSAALVSGRLDLRHFGLDPQVEYNLWQRIPAALLNVCVVLQMHMPAACMRATADDCQLAAHLLTEETRAANI
jgi:hypothetical protein